MFNSTVIDLFNSDHSTVDTCSQAANAPMPIPAAIQSIENIFQREIELRLEIQRRADALDRELRAVPEMSYERIDLGEACDRGFFRKYVSRATKIATVALSTPTAPFDPNKNDILEAEWNDYQRLRCYDSELAKTDPEIAAVWQAFSPCNVWRQLLKHHNPKAQEKAACAADARVIALQFGMVRRRGEPSEMKIVKGRVEIVINVYTEAGWGGSSGRRLNGDGLYKLGGAIKSTLVRLNSPSAAIGESLMQLAEQFSRNDRSVVSRERVDLGSGAGIVQGYQTFKLYLPMQVAQAINMFIAEHPEAISDY